MAAEDTLASVLSDFARTMLTDFSIQTILDHLVDRIVSILDITGAGVTVISPGVSPYYLAASSNAALRFEQLQTNLGQGPCLSAYQTGELVAIPDLAADQRYPQFSQAAVAAGLAAVFTFPLRNGEGGLGALDLYRDRVGALDSADLTTAQTLADVTSAYLLNAQGREQILQASERYKASALQDSLTGLANRTLLEQRLEHVAALAQRSHSTTAVLFADIDRFKQINDSYGHSVGDSVLVAVGQRLTALLRPGDTLARVSGDEFVILCENLASPSDGEVLAGRINDAFLEPFQVDEHELNITASVGVAYCGPGETISYQLLIDADTAMYEAKRAGGADHRVVDLDLAKQERDHYHLEQELRSALKGTSLAVAYQPIVRAADGAVTGVEALLRWTHPIIGSVPAITTIEVAEHSNLIAEIGSWVLASSCADYARWRTAYPDCLLDLSVNIATKQLVAPGFLQLISDLLERSKMEPTDLVLDLTEGIFIDNDEPVTDVLAELRRLGVRLALDDFCTGHSSLNYLRRFPVDIVKIGQEFVADIGRDPTAAAIVGAVTQLTHELGMTVTAEGVEARPQRDRLIDLGCERAQGFLFAEPMTNAEFTALLSRPGRRPLCLPAEAR